MDVRQTEAFRDWFAALRDHRARAKIAARLRRVSIGHLGDAKSVGGGVHELRVDHGPGYRLYYTRRGDTVLVLLCGGDKSSQERDIRAARRLAEEV